MRQKNAIQSIRESKRVYLGVLFSLTISNSDFYLFGKQYKAKILPSLTLGIIEESNKIIYGFGVDL